MLGLDRLALLPHPQAHIVSAAKVCDNCGTTLVLDANGEDEDGEVNVWLRLSTTSGRLGQDACTRSCAVALLADDQPLAAALDAHLAELARISRVIAEDDGNE